MLWSLKGAPAVHFNFPLLSFSLYTTFKTGIAAACEPIPLECRIVPLHEDDEDKNNFSRSTLTALSCPQNRERKKKDLNHIKFYLIISLKPKLNRTMCSEYSDIRIYSNIY